MNGLPEIRGIVRRDEALLPHTSFRVGGTADLFAEPADEADLIDLLSWARRHQVEHFFLGGGSNLVVSDHGFRGLVISTAALTAIASTGTRLTCAAGASMSDASAFAADHALGGLDFIYAMPGSVGGAVWMNARCYDGSIDEVLERVRYVDATGLLHDAPVDRAQWSYKVSPFQTNGAAIVAATFTLHPDHRQRLWSVMHEHQNDRHAKGHFQYPCAGSVFKNNRRFGAPSGQIIDSLNLRGTRIGDAMISDAHANIIVNRGKASAFDIRSLVSLVQRAVLDRYGFDLEPEVLFIGDWSAWQP